MVDIGDGLSRKRAGGKEEVALDRRNGRNGLQHSEDAHLLTMVKCVSHKLSSWRQGTLDQERSRTPVCQQAEMP